MLTQLVFVFRLRENVPLNCTACPKDYVPNPTLDRPRRCTLQPQRFAKNDLEKVQRMLHQASSDEYDDKLSVDGVHCGEDSGLGSVWEANLRMPTLMQWPAKIPANTSSMALVSSLDITPTFLSLVFGNASIQNDQFDFDGLDISAVVLGRDHEYNSDQRVLFFWRDGFLLDPTPLGPPYGRFDVVAVKVGRIKAWFWTKSAHYNFDFEVYHDPPLLFDTIEDPAEAFPIAFPHNDTSNEYAQLVQRMHLLVVKHKLDVASFDPYPLTLPRDSKNIPCVDPSTGCRTT
jgi:C-terminal region of aryl-sulfatase